MIVLEQIMFNIHPVDLNRNETVLNLLKSIIIRIRALECKSLEDFKKEFASRFHNQYPSTTFEAFVDQFLNSSSFDFELIYSTIISWKSDSDPQIWLNWFNNIIEEPSIQQFFNMNWTPSLVLQVLIASFEILRGHVFILEGTIGCGKSSILGVFLSLARSAKIIHSDIFMNAEFSVEEIKRKMNQAKEDLIQQNSNEKNISVLNLDEATATSSISILMDLLFEGNNTFSCVASIQPSVNISLLQKLFALLGNFQKRIVSSPNVALQNLNKNQTILKKKI
jgi:hypothetical protein